jgi:outer membrane immunogenic protein
MSDFSMKPFNKVPLVLAAICALSGMAQAADLPSPLAPPDFMPPALSWSGMYVGVNGGYVWSANSNQLALSTDRPTGLNSTGWLGGGQIGYNYQMSRMVLGVETDLAASSIGGSVHDLNFGDTTKLRLGDLGTLRGRVGYTFDRVLVYATGGFAYGSLSSSVSGPVLLDGPYSYSGVATGYVLGAGVEYAIDRNWSIRGEYEYVNFGKHDPRNASGAPYSQIAGGGYATVKSDEFNLFRIGLNYKLY